MVQLLEGCGMLMQAFHGLQQSLAAERGSVGGALLLPPPLQRAVMRGEEVAGTLATLSQVLLEGGASRGGGSAGRVGGA